MGTMMPHGRRVHSRRTWKCRRVRRDVRLKEGDPMNTRQPRRHPGAQLGGRAAVAVLALTSVLCASAQEAADAEAAQGADVHDAWDGPFVVAAVERHAIPTDDWFDSSQRLFDSAIAAARATPVARARLGVTTQQPPTVRERSTQRKVVGAIVGGIGGFFGGLFLGAAIEGDRCNCDDPGFVGALIGAPVGGVAGSVLGYKFLF